MEIMRQTPWSRIREQYNVNKSRRLLAMEANRQCPKGDNCSFRHGTNKRTKSDTAEHFSRIFYVAE